jgi:predicted metal-binding membrane protein
VWALKDRRPFITLLIALIVLSWLVLFVWGESPYGQFLSHEGMSQTNNLCWPDGLSSTFNGQHVLLILIFVLGWTLMTVAMMLPTSLPLVSLFHSITRQRPNRAYLVALLIIGYLFTWLLFGFAAHIGYWGLHEAIDRNAGLETNAWILGASVILLAGLYQFTPLKYYCLEKCRSPFSFISEHWQGTHEKMQAFKLGVHHGIFCIGCCWALMLLMFAVGVWNVGWMLALGAVMAVEKNLPWGRRLSTPLGIALLCWGLILIAFGLR